MTFKYDHCYEAYASLSRRYVAALQELHELRLAFAQLQEHVEFQRELIKLRKQVDDLKDELLRKPGT